MKLYSEEQLREVVRLSLEDAEKSVIWSKESYPSKLADIIMKDLTPIELPSDEEIEESSLKWFMTANKREIIFDLGWMKIFEAGAKYVIDKIQGGNK
jgi:hypothetical protein